jgi:hemoglobin
METQSLYERLGGAAGINTLVDEIVAAHLDNPLISARFRPVAADPEKLSAVKDHLHKFLAAGSGGPNDYAGRSMPEAHRGMNISVAEYMAAVDDIMGVLEQNRIDEVTRKDMLAIAYALKNEIVHH